MFQSISRGFGFLKQAIDMAVKDRDLLKPSFIALVVGAVVSVVGAIPIILGAIAFGNSSFGQFVVFLLGALLLLAEYTVSYVFAGMTAYLIYGYLAEGDGRMDKAWEVVKRDFFDIVTLALASTIVKLIENMLRGRGRRRAGGLLGGLLANLLATVWTTATYFVLPAMVIEDLNLGQGLKRATYMIKNNLLLVAVTEIGVGGVVGFIGFVLIFGAIALGVGIFVGLGSLFNWGVFGIVVGGGLAVIVAGTVIATVTALSGYVTTAYHTSMFLWAREVERARAQGMDEQMVRAPAPVAAVLA